MHNPKKNHPNLKPGLHPRNRHSARYDFDQLVKHSSNLEGYLKLNQYGDISIDFSNPDSVFALNKALLKSYYNIEYWSIPEGYLCPPIPGRADYIHHAADLLARSNHGIIPIGDQIRCLDIGVGANCVYPIVGIHDYNWSFVGSDIDVEAIEAAKIIVERNSLLKDRLTLRLQPEPKDIFKTIFQSGELFDLVVCNPPFHASQADAEAGTFRKLGNLSKQNKPILTRNFGGLQAELWCEGGELGFINAMISQSKTFGDSCFWFSTLVSKESNLEKIVKSLRGAGAFDHQTISMAQGNKKSRFIAWTFLDSKAQNNWVNKRWTRGL